MAVFRVTFKRLVAERGFSAELHRWVELGVP